jgi:hypothetical protein
VEARDVLCGGLQGEQSSVDLDSAVDERLARLEYEEVDERVALSGNGRERSLESSPADVRGQPPDLIATIDRHVESLTSQRHLPDRSLRNHRPVVREIDRSGRRCVDPAGADRKARWITAHLVAPEQEAARTTPG